MDNMLDVSNILSFTVYNQKTQAITCSGGKMVMVSHLFSLFIGIITGRHVTRRVTCLPVHDYPLTDSPFLSSISNRLSNFFGKGWSNDFLVEHTGLEPVEKMPQSQ